MEGYFSYAVPAYPDLPCTIVRFAVPYDALKKSIQITYSVKETKNLGKYSIREVSPMATWGGNRRVVGEKADIYSKDDFFPEKVIEDMGFSQMRKWKFISLKYTPFQYNPVSRELRYLPEVDVTITYTVGARISAGESALADTKMDDRAKNLFQNYSEAEAWYNPTGLVASPSVTYDYVIITTNSIESNSTQLSSFISYLSGKGYSPLVITEDEYGSLTGQSPDGTAEKIRKWLIDNYSSYGILYVLLIGNPDPDDPSSDSDSIGDVPMKMCWPRRAESSYTSYKESPTDYFYADLTGNWDLNGNDYFGEYDGDRGSEGVDFANEVYVGRIPVYSGVTDLDSVLTKTMNYGNATGIGWRKSALLPMSFSDSDTDGAYLSEAMISDYLSPGGYSDYTLYMKGSVCAAADSTFSSDGELISGATATRWSNDTYGMVWWWGHGSETSASLGYSGCGWGTIMTSSNAALLNDSYPSHVYQCSCLNGYPENTGNLGTALLYNGAITTTSASRVSWYAITSWNTGLKYNCDNASIGYYYGQELVANSKEASKALYDVKSDMGVNGGYFGAESWMNLFDFNLYGDPATSIVSEGIPCPDCPSNGVIADVTYPVGETCSCSNDTAITLDNVIVRGNVTFTAPSVSGKATIEDQATITIDATTVRLGSEFHAQSGSTVNISQGQ